MKYIQLVKVAAKCKTVTGKILKKGDEAIRLSSDRTTGEIYIVTKEEFENALTLPPKDMAPVFTKAQKDAVQKRGQETKKRRVTLRKIYEGIKNELLKHNFICSEIRFNNSTPWLCNFQVRPTQTTFLASPTTVEFWNEKITARIYSKSKKFEGEYNDPNSIENLINYLTK